MAARAVHRFTFAVHSRLALLGPPVWRFPVGPCTSGGSHVPYVRPAAAVRGRGWVAPPRGLSPSRLVDRRRVPCTPALSRAAPVLRRLPPLSVCVSPLTATRPSATERPGTVGHRRRHSRHGCARALDPMSRRFVCIGQGALPMRALPRLWTTPDRSAHSNHSFAAARDDHPAQPGLTDTGEPVVRCPAGDVSRRCRTHFGFFFL